MIKFGWLACGLVMLGLLISGPADAGEIFGKLIKSAKDRRGLPGVQVMACIGSKCERTYTDRNGNFWFSDLRKGRYAIRTVSSRNKVVRTVKSVNLTDRGEVQLLLVAP